MRCFDNLLIRRYIDNEASANEIAWVEMHIKECGDCSARLLEQQQNTTLIKRALNQIVHEEIEIPAFSVTKKSVVVHSLSIRKKIIYSVSAACFALLILGICHTTNNKKTEQVYLINSFSNDINANLPISQQELIINVIDPDGNITEYPVR